MLLRIEGLMAGCALAGFLSSAQGQTIGDYSRAQRAVIEAAIARNGSASAAPPAQPSPLPALPSPSSPAAAPVPKPEAVVPPSRDDPADAELLVTGVVVTAASSIAEVVVDGVAYLLVPGQTIPGTPWQVATVADDRVVLHRRGTGGRRVVSVGSAGH